MWRGFAIRAAMGATAAAGALLVSCSSAPSGTTTTPAVPDSGAAATAGVSVRNFAFDPSSVGASAGTPVTWTVVEGTHRIVATDGADFDSGPISAGSTFTWSPDFAATGEVAYRCEIHPNQMTGTIALNG